MRSNRRIRSWSEIDWVSGVSPWYPSVAFWRIKNHMVERKSYKTEYSHAPVAKKSTYVPLRRIICRDRRLSMRLGLARWSMCSSFGDWPRRPGHIHCQLWIGGAYGGWHQWDRWKPSPRIRRAYRWVPLLVLQHGRGLARSVRWNRETLFWTSSNYQR